MGARYVDKTAFVADVVTATSGAMLFPRPRRFGKTMNLSTLRCFVEKGNGDARPLFSGLAIEQRPEAWEHFQRYPVIFLTFKDVKASNYALALAAIKSEIGRAYNQHRYLLDSDALSAAEKRRFSSVLGGEGDEALYWAALRDLSAHLTAYHGERVAILVDEYDTAIHAGFSAGYYREVIQFFRNFLSGGFKDNPHLWKGVLTGILRVAKESIFSGINNLTVYSILRPELSSAFGFTPNEVEALARDVGHEGSLADVERWYNGYRFAGQVIYNPWSVLNFLASEDRVLRPYWVSSGSMDLVRDMLLSRTGEEAAEIEALLKGKSIKKRIDENIALRDLPPESGVVWGFLLFTGYLTATRVRQREELTEVRLAVPNREVRGALRTIFRAWLTEGLGGDKHVDALARALVSGDATMIERLLEELSARSLSYHDTGRGPGEAERVYHAFVLGLLVWLTPRYRVSSNRESGFGRYDVMIAPRRAGEPGIVMEIKAVDKRRRETVKAAMASALGQLRDKDYAAELRAAGASPIWEVGVVFEGKRVKVAVVARP